MSSSRCADDIAGNSTTSHANRFANIVPNVGRDNTTNGGPNGEFHYDANGSSKYGGFSNKEYVRPAVASSLSGTSTAESSTILDPNSIPRADHNS